jgi:hypothetical protein
LAAGRRGALKDRPPLEQLHAHVGFVLDGLGNELAVEEIEHLPLARGIDVDFDVEPDVLRLRSRPRRLARYCPQAHCDSMKAFEWQSARLPRE